MDGIKGRITFAKERIERFLVNTNKTAKEQRNEEYLTARVQLLNSYWAQFMTAYEEFYANSSAEVLASDPYVTSDAFLDVECTYIATLHWLKDNLATFSPKQSKDDHKGSPLHSTFHTQPSSTPQLKLPRINLPSFSGSHTDWPSFHDTYVALIHDNDSLPDVQKLHYLKSAITGEAAKLLRHFATTDANYKSAWKLIFDRFKNTRVLVSANLRSLISLPSMVRESCSELQRVFDTFKQSVRALENLSRPVDYWDDWLIYFLSDKLDATTRKDWETSLSSSTEVPTFSSLAGFLERRLQALSAIKDTQLLTNAAAGQRQFSVQKFQQSRRPSSSTHHVFTKASNTTSSTCLSCKGKHLVMFCPQFRSMSIDQRVDLLRRKLACNNCLRANHTATSCPSTNRCKLCQAKHHTMIHRSTEPSESNPTQKTNMVNVPEAPCPSTTAHLSLDGLRFSSVLLPTVIVQVEAPNGRQLQVRALLDQGSESNFITSSLVKLLSLRKQKTRIAIFGVAQCEAGIAQSRVELDVISLHDSTHRYSVQFLVMPTLSQLLPGFAVSKQAWPHLNLPLADPNFDQPSSIDLILGV